MPLSGCRFRSRIGPYDFHVLKKRKPTVRDTACRPDGEISFSSPSTSSAPQCPRACPPWWRFEKYDAMRENHTFETDEIPLGLGHPACGPRMICHRPNASLVRATVALLECESNAFSRARLTVGTRRVPATIIRRRNIRVRRETRFGAN